MSKSQRAEEYQDQTDDHDEDESEDKESNGRKKNQQQRKSKKKYLNQIRANLVESSHLKAQQKTTESSSSQYRSPQASPLVQAKQRPGSKIKQQNSL